MTWLLDTNVISELKRASPDARVVSFLLGQRSEDLYVSVITLAEIRYGIELEARPERRLDLESWLEDVVRPMFEGRVVPVTEDVMLRWRILVGQGRKKGRTYSEPDLLLAASALEHGSTFVTRNVKDFVGLDLTLLNPWEI